MKKDVHFENICASLLIIIKRPQKSLVSSLIFFIKPSLEYIMLQKKQKNSRSYFDRLSLSSIKSCFDVVYLMIGNVIAEA